MPLSHNTLTLIADEVMELLANPREVAPFSMRFPGYEIEDAYFVVNDVRRRREAEGDRVIGRKIGFTDAMAWEGYGISGPIWNYLYESTPRTLPLQEFPLGTSAFPAALLVANWLLRTVLGFSRERLSH
jgi:hypothetical protein